MDQILDRLWLGSVKDAEAYAHPEMQAYPMHAILTLNEVAPLAVARTITHAYDPIPDEVFLTPAQWHHLIGRMHDLLWHHQRILVHCRLGVSRSPALVAAYLVHCGHSWDPATALAYIARRHPNACPHAETWRGILAWNATWRTA